MTTQKLNNKEEMFDKITSHEQLIYTMGMHLADGDKNKVVDSAKNVYVGKCVTVLGIVVMTITKNGNEWVKNIVECETSEEQIFLTK